MHYIAVRPDRDPQPVRRFECFTADLHRLADWLRSRGVKTVAMQSTGVYWISIYEFLKNVASKCVWPIHGTRRICRDGRAGRAKGC
jgi:hypothetical protein